ncbi:MAG: DUF2493 domain-containing protein [Planctomycetota bacterium]
MDLPHSFHPSDDDTSCHNTSATQATLDRIAVFGTTPSPDEPEHRAMPTDEELAGLVSALTTELAEALDDTALEDDLAELLWGVGNVLHRRVQFLDKLLGQNEDRQRGLCDTQDGSEVQSVELERALNDGGKLLERRDAHEAMRDAAAERYAALTGSPWMPRSGSRVSHRGLTSAVIDSRAFQAAKRRRDTEIHCPEGTRIAFTGGTDCDDYPAILKALDRCYAKYPDMVLLHGGASKGAELIAAKWAEGRGVAQVVFRPDWSAHGKAAPFKRNDRLLEEMPQGVVAFPGSGITENLVDKARRLGIRIMRPAATTVEAG